MRPRKRILVIDSDETRLSVTRYVLSNWRYAVYGAATTKEAVRLLADRSNDFRLVMGCAPLPEQAFSMAACSRNVPSLMICERADAQVHGLADRTLFAPSMATVLDTVKVLSARKREPKKGTKRKPVRSVTLADLIAPDMAMLEVAG